MVKLTICNHTTSKLYLLSAKLHLLIPKGSSLIQVVKQKAQHSNVNGTSLN